MKYMHTKTERTFTIILTVFLALTICVFNASAQPLMPHRFYGEVAGFPDGTLVEAKIEGVTYANTTTLNGTYGYLPNVFDVPGDDPNTPEKEGGVTGDTVNFYVAGIFVTSYTFESGASTRLDLSIPLIANFTATPTSGDEPLTVQFTDTSQLAEAVTSWLWDFGDETNSTEQNPEHTYTTDGNYTVSLTVVGDGEALNLTETKPDYITVYDTEPNANFYGTPMFGAPPLTVQFTDQSGSYDGIISRLWNFGDDTTGTEKNPQHTYTTEGVYTVSLNVTEEDGDWDVEVKPNYVIVTTNVTEPVNVMVDVGSIHFPGETAEFYIFTLYKGLAVNVEFLEVRLWFYYAEEHHYVDLASPVKLEAGVYRASYTIPETAPAVTYTLIIKAQYRSPDGMSYGGSAKSFQVSPTLNGWNASITKIEDNIATIVIPGLTEIKANLTAINAKLVDIQGTTASINSTLGLIKTDITNINAYLASLNRTIATISSDVGEIKTDVDAIHLKVVGVDWETKIADIQTTLGTIKGYVENVDDGGLATINTDLGNVTTNISDILTTSQDTQNTANTLTTIVYAALAFSILAFIAAIATAYMLRSKLA